MQPGNPSMPEPGRSCRKGSGNQTSPAWEGRRSGYEARAPGDGGTASLASGQSSLFGRRSVRTHERAQTFLRIRWWDALQEANGLPVLREATLCKLHRMETALKFPDARGCGQIGTSCEFCDSRTLRGA
jgi:hypothetical protein